jgi:hypothetical protein
VTGECKNSKAGDRFCLATLLGTNLKAPAVFVDQKTGTRGDDEGWLLVRNNRVKLLFETLGRRRKGNGGWSGGHRCNKRQCDFRLVTRRKHSRGTTSSVASDF